MCSAWHPHTAFLPPSHCRPLLPLPVPRVAGSRQLRTLRGCGRAGRGAGSHRHAAGALRAGCAMQPASSCCFVAGVTGPSTHGPLAAITVSSCTISFVCSSCCSCRRLKPSSCCRGWGSRCRAACWPSTAPPAASTRSSCAPSECAVEQRGLCSCLLECLVVLKAWAARQVSYRACWWDEVSRALCLRKCLVVMAACAATSGLTNRACNLQWALPAFLLLYSDSHPFACPCQVAGLRGVRLRAHHHRRHAAKLRLCCIHGAGGSQRCRTCAAAADPPRAAHHAARAAAAVREPVLMAGSCLS